MLGLLALLALLLYFLRGLAVASLACSPAATAAAATAAELVEPALAMLLACARRNLQHVKVYLQARVHVSSFWLNPSLILASPILSRLMAYGSFSPGMTAPAAAA